MLNSESHFNSARASLRQALTQYGQLQRQPAPPPIQAELEILKANLEKLETGLIKIAAFGLVSRGKSAVLNALMGQKILQTGPLHGVTQYPRSVRWTPGNSGKVQVELIDTPGLDEIQGQARTQMAQDVARQADLILFVVAGDITRTEYQALLFLQEAQKPLILVFNKIDLYPEEDINTIYHTLQKLGGTLTGKPLVNRDEIVCIAAEPMPRQMRVEYPDGRVNYEWETPAPDILPLKQKILDLLNREGRSLLALNALVQAREAETNIARKTLEFRQSEAEDLIWKFAQYKALAVAINPIAIVDVVGGAVADLALIRQLGKLYGLPITNYEAGKLLKIILLSSGGLILGELGSSLLFGLGKSGAAIAGAAGEGGVSIPAFASSAIAQGAIAGYSAYQVGKAAQVYLEQGCTWGPLGANRVIRDILTQVEPNTVLYRLRSELELNL